MKLAAIDIGSNAARLLITEVTKNKDELTFTKLNLCRVPLRLGFDVFKNGKISLLLFANRYDMVCLEESDRRGKFAQQKKDESSDG